MGIEIIGIGFNTRDTEIFGKYIQLDEENAELVVEALIKIARRKVNVGRLPDGNLVPQLEIGIERSSITNKEKVEKATEQARSRDLGLYRLIEMSI